MVVLSIAWSGKASLFFFAAQFLLAALFIRIVPAIIPVYIRDSRSAGLALLAFSPVWWYGGRYVNNGDIPFQKRKNDQVRPDFGGVNTLYDIRLEYWAFIVIFIACLFIFIP